MEQDIFLRLKNGNPVSLLDPEYHRISEACLKTKQLLLELNASAQPETTRELLGRITGAAIAESVTVFTPIHINYGRNIRFGKNVFVNFDCTFLDLGGIQIDDEVFIAPGVKLLSEGHPLDPKQRRTLTTGRIHIGKNAWIGANATILQGVTIGENSVVAAGAVVSKDVAPNTLVGGIPARLIKTI